MAQVSSCRVVEDVNTIITTAMNGFDYTGITMAPVAFPAGSMDTTEQCLNISILGDSDALEGDEMFTVTLMDSDDDVMLNNAMTNIAISDNEG